MEIEKLSFSREVGGLARGGHHPSDPTGMSVPDGVADPGLSGTVP